VVKKLERTKGEKGGGTELFVCLKELSRYWPGFSEQGGELEWGIDRFVSKNIGRRFGPTKNKGTDEWKT